MNKYEAEAIQAIAEATGFPAESISVQEITYRAKSSSSNEKTVFAYHWVAHQGTQNRMGQYVSSNGAGYVSIGFSECVKAAAQFWPTCNVAENHSAALSAQLSRLQTLLCLATGFRGDSHRNELTEKAWEFMETLAGTRPCD